MKEVRENARGAADLRVQPDCGLDRTRIAYRVVMQLAGGGNHRRGDDVRRDAAERLSVVILVAPTPRPADVPWRRPGPRPAGTLRLPSGCAIRAGCHRRTAPSLRRPPASRCP